MRSGCIERNIELIRPGVQSDAASGARVGVRWTSTGCIVDLPLRRVAEPPKPILHHFPDDRSISDWPDAAERSGRCEAAARRRCADRHGEQPIVVANPLRPEEQINVEAVYRAGRPHLDS
jgi:hypothetical protein